MALDAGEVEATLRLRDELSAQISEARKNLKGFGDAAMQAGGALTAGLTLPIMAVGGASLKMAMDAVESENLFEVSFKGMAGQARDWSNQTSQALGLNQYELRRTSGLMFTMFESMGIAKGGAFAMSTGLTTLSADMASFFNLRPEEAFEKLKAGITGQSDPLMALGINVKEATIQAYAYKTGIAAQGAELTEQQKVLARYGSIMEQTKNAQGDLARTLDSPTNQLRIMKEKISEAAVAFGMALMPAAQMVIGFFASHVVPTIQAAVEIFGNLPGPVRMIAAAAAVLVAALGPLLLAFGMLATGLSNVIGLFGMFGAASAKAAAASTTQAAAATTAATATSTLGVALRMASIAAVLLGAAVVGWAVGKWIANLRLFGDAAMSVGEAFEFGFTKISNWARGIKASDADIETAITSRRLLGTTTKAVANVEQEVADAMKQAAAAASAEAAALATSEGAAKANAEAKKAAAEATRKFTEAATEASFGIQRLVAANAMLIPSIQTMNVSLSAAATQLKSAALGAYELGHGLMALPSAVSQGVSASVPIIRSFGESIKATMGGALQGLPSVILGALQGGGNVGGAIGGSIFGTLFNAAGPLVTGVTKTLSSTLGSTIGGAMGSMIPGIGTLLGGMAGQLIGPLIGKIGGYFAGLFGGPSGIEVEGRRVAATFRDQIAQTLSQTQLAEAGSDEWKKSVIGVRDAFIAAGRTEQEALDIMDRLWKAEKQGGDAVANVIREIQGVMQSTSGTIAAATASATAGFENVRETVASIIPVADDLNATLAQPIVKQVTVEMSGGGGGAGSGNRFPGRSFDEWYPGWIAAHPGDAGRARTAYGEPEAFDAGSSFIRNTGLAMIHEGEQVVPAKGDPWKAERDAHGAEMVGMLAAIETHLRDQDRRIGMAVEHALTLSRGRR